MEHNKEKEFKTSAGRVVYSLLVNDVSDGEYWDNYPHSKTWWEGYICAYSHNHPQMNETGDTQTLIESIPTVC